eukprot:TRINITY_DN8253_c0_g1_i1.p1 TRINITY_DN8253_c0_g1~~TRINITY_DN8253_c0_g1_i1.p1  ORF type:complete len:355 (+),score=65.84 TRINITY_DN8253_c0_g1_i1:163-1227(+)
MYYRYGYWNNYYNTTPYKTGAGVNEKNFASQFKDKFLLAPSYTEIRRLVGQSSYGRGVEYQRSKSIKDFKFTGENELSAKCESLTGNSSSAYKVKIDFEMEDDVATIIDYDCSCPVKQSKCKHVASCLLEWKEGTSVPYACQNNFSLTLLLLIAYKIDPKQLEKEKFNTRKRKASEEEPEKIELTEKYSEAFRICENYNSEACLEILKDLFSGMLWNRERHTLFPTVQQKAIETFMLSIKFHVQNSISNRFPRPLLYVIIQLSVDLFLRDENVPAPTAEIPEEEEEKCPVCNKETREERMVGCYECEKWVHYECDEIDESVTKLASNVEYFCVKCRKDNDGKFAKVDKRKKRKN